MARTIKIRPKPARVYIEDDGKVVELSGGETEPPEGATVFEVETPTIVDLLGFDPQRKDATEILKLAHKAIRGWSGLRDQEGHDLEFEPRLINKLPLDDLVALISWMVGEMGIGRDAQEKNGLSGSLLGLRASSGPDTPASPTA